MFWTLETTKSDIEFHLKDYVKISLWKQPSFFAPGPSGVSCAQTSFMRNATWARSEEGPLFSQAMWKCAFKETNHKKINQNKTYKQGLN